MGAGGMGRADSSADFSRRFFLTLQSGFFGVSFFCYIFAD